MINRRDFLKASSAAAVAGLAASVVSMEAQAHTLGKLFKGASGGRLYESVDGGQRWQESANFGPECQIVRLYMVGKILHAELAFRGYSFTLTSADGRKWYSRG
ncbi:MAG: twin-arginine translocation signal domain-containing protein [Chloroflexota bacterium]|nr:MAG: twin-arginine translocation signal domain-containing protein [Chloroflexota bacterium]